MRFGGGEVLLLLLLITRADGCKQRGLFSCKDLFFFSFLPSIQFFCRLTCPTELSPPPLSMIKFLSKGCDDMPTARSPPLRWRLSYLAVSFPPGRTYSTRVFWCRPPLLYPHSPASSFFRFLRFHQVSTRMIIQQVTDDVNEPILTITAPEAQRRWQVGSGDWKEEKKRIRCHWTLNGYLQLVGQCLYRRRRARFEPGAAHRVTCLGSHWPATFSFGKARATGEKDGNPRELWKKEKNKTKEFGR